MVNQMVNIDIFKRKLQFLLMVSEIDLEVLCLLNEVENDYDKSFQTLFRKSFPSGNQCSSKHVPSARLSKLVLQKGCTVVKTSFCSKKSAR